jgi:hypothetical protein
VVRWLPWTIALAVGCRFTPGHALMRDGAGAADVPMVDVPGIDTPPDAARDCLASWETGPLSLSAPALISELSGGTYDRDVFVTPDELTLYWSSQRGSDVVPHIYRATRTHWANPWGSITMATDLDSASTDGKVSMTSDGKDAVLASDRAGHVGITANYDIWELTRSNPQGTFGTPSETLLKPAVDSLSDQLDPALTWDGLTLYWADSTSGHQQVIVASRSSRTSAFGSTSIAVDNLMGVADPAVSRDGLVLLFTQNTTTNGSDVFYATRGTTGGVFGSPIALTDIDTGSEEGDAFLSYDACDVFFSSTQQSSGVYQLFVSHVQ